MPRRHDLGQDPDCDVGRCVTAEIQPDRGVDAPDLRFVESNVAQARHALGVRSPAAERPDVEGAAPQRGDECRVVDLRVVGGRHDVGGLVDPGAIPDLVEPALDERVGIGEALLGRRVDLG